MIIALFFLVFSLLILIIIGIVVASSNKKSYTEKVRKKLGRLGYTFVSIEDEEPFENDNPFFIYNYGSSIFYKIFKKVTFHKSDKSNNSIGYVVVEHFFFFIKSIKIYSSDKKTLLT